MPMIVNNFSIGMGTFKTENNRMHSGNGLKKKSDLGSL